MLSERRGKVVVRGGKGGVYREVPLHPPARKALRAWLDTRPAHRGAETSTALFLNRRGGRLLVRSIRTIVAETAVAARLVHDTKKPRVHPHTLRHTVATQMLRKGIDTVIIADVMGHARVDTTRQYARSSEVDRLRAITEALVADE